MMRKLTGFLFFLVMCGFCSPSPGYAQAAATPSRIAEGISEARLAKLPSNTHPLARAEFDRGIAPAELPMDRMLLVLNPSAEQKTTLENLLAQQQNPSSPNYHKWLTPQQFGKRFGASLQDIQTVTGWLQSHGFQVKHAANGRNLIEFSGSAGQVRQAFHTEIHQYVVNGRAHWANSADPQIPAALASLVAGVATLHDFAKKPQVVFSNAKFQAVAAPGSARPQFTGSNGQHALAPPDFDTIYSLQYPAWNTTIAVVGRSNINVADVNQFQTYFNLGTSSPQIIVNGPDPGDLGGGEEGEAVLDVSWAGAVALGAAIDLVISKTTNTTDGVDLSEAYIIDNNLADIMSESFGSCEATATQADVSLHLALAQQAAAQGITYVVAAGDSGAEGCDDPSKPPASHPLSVNYIASTPYNIAVGGTQFNENGHDATYWASANIAPGYYGSALSYIPENVWNESSSTAGLWSGGGGASKLFPKPAWQTGVPGIPNDGARDVPDVSLTAAGHDPYLICLAGSCTPDANGRFYFQGAAGTSAATPSFAAILASVVSWTNTRQGQANYWIYRLAAIENLTACNGSNTSALPAVNCVFRDVTVGNNAVPGESGYGTSGAAYQASVGYDLATGLGSVNADGLIAGSAYGNSLGNPQLSISATSLDFGNQYLGLSSAQTVTLTNTGDAEVTLGFNSYFEWPNFSESDNCRNGIPPGGSCTVTVVFKPQVSGTLSGVAELTTNAFTSPIEITATGTGLVSTTLMAASAVLDFGNQNVLTRGVSTVAVANSTLQPVNISNISLAGVNAGEFAEINNCPTTLYSATACTISVYFNPLLLGAKQGTLEIANDASASPLAISLAGTAAASGPFQIMNRLTGKALDVIGASQANGALIQQWGPNGSGQQQWELVGSDGVYSILNELTGKVLDVTGASDANGTLIQQWATNDSGQQTWQLVPVDDAYYKVVNALTGKVLDVTGASWSDGTLIQQWDWNGGWQQQWQLVPIYGRTIVNRLTGKALDVRGASTADGASIQQWNANGSEQQSWELIPLGGGLFRIQNMLSGKVLDVTGASTSDGTLIQQWDWQGGWQQQWQLILLPEGYYQMVNRLTGKVLDVIGASTSNGTRIQQWDWHGDWQQQWQITP